MDKENSGKILTVLLVIIVFCLSGFIVYDNFFKEVEKNNITSSDELNNLDKNDNNISYNEFVIANNLYNKVTVDSFYGSDVFEEYYEENKITDNIIVAVGLKETRKVGYYDIGDKISKKELNNQIDKIFDNKSISNYIENVDINCSNYNLSGDLYLIGSSGCGGPVTSGIKRKIENIYKEDDKLYLIEKTLFLKLEEGIGSNKLSVYKNYEKKHNFYDLIDVVTFDKNFNDLDPNDNNLNDKIDKYFDNANSYRYEFTLINGNYYFTSFELLK